MMKRPCPNRQKAIVGNQCGALFATAMNLHHRRFLTLTVEHSKPSGQSQID
jgi:hypothetical protein